MATGSAFNRERSLEGDKLSAIKLLNQELKFLRTPITFRPYARREEIITYMEKKTGKCVGDYGRWQVAGIGAAGRRRECS